jgi:uncharacterized protein (DUF2141 family)
MNIRFRSLAFASLALSAVALPSIAQGGELTLTIRDIRSTQGHVQVAVMSSEAAWNGEGSPVAGRKVAVTGQELVLKFDLPAGSYAVQVLHDENDNNQLDANLMGIPTEGYGFSNNPQVMRRATFSEARFEVGDAPAAMVIRLR